MKKVLGVTLSLLLISPLSYAQTQPSMENLILNSLQSNQLNQPNGVAGLDGTGKVPTANLPAMGAVIGTASGQARDAALAISAEQAAQATASAAIPTSTLGQPSGPAKLDGNGKVLTVSLINRPTIAPLTTTVGTTATTIFPAATYLSIRLAPTATGSLACTGDGSTPVLGGTGQVSYGQDIHWPVVAGGATPTGAVQCIAVTSSVITTEAH